MAHKQCHDEEKFLKNIFESLLETIKNPYFCRP